MKIMPGFIATELVILTFDSVNEMILLMNKTPSHSENMLTHVTIQSLGLFPLV